MTVRPTRPSYMPPPTYIAHRGDPVDGLPGADELRAELTGAIGERLSQGERHTHPKRGGCDTCAAEAADTAVRYLEANTRVVRSDLLAFDEHDRAHRAIASIRYLGSDYDLRLRGDLARHPEYPTVDDLLHDIETVAVAVNALLDADRARDAELHQYRKWREAVRDLATRIVDQHDRLEPDPLADCSTPGPLSPTMDLSGWS